MLKPQRTNKNWHRRQRGMQLVEMAFLMPIMLMLLGVIGEFGRYFHMRSTLLRATRTAAAYMWDKQNTPANITAAKRMALCGQPTACTNPAQLVYPGLTEANFNVVVAPITVSGITSNYVTVSTVNAMFVPIFNITRLAHNPNNPDPPAVWGARAVNVSTRMSFMH